MLCDNTPIEAYTLAGRKVWVKREDLSCSAPGPPFSKMRGVIEHIANRPEKVFGVLDTYHSKAGWAVAYACKMLRRKCINFYPVYKGDDPTSLREPQRRSKALGALLSPLPAGRSFILYNQARAKLKTLSPSAYLMPNALKLAESVEATAREVQSSVTKIRSIKPAHVVVSISSGTIAAGVLVGLFRLRLPTLPEVWLHEGYNRPQAAVIAYLRKMAVGVTNWPTIHLIDEDYAYKDTAPKECTAPFPCNPWYDLKAWAWLKRHVPELSGPVLFWTIGD